MPLVLGLKKFSLPLLSLPWNNIDAHSCMSFSRKSITMSPTVLTSRVK